MRIAITGGIGSGKSYVCGRLRQRGITVYDCDAAAKRLMRSSADLQRRLEELVGERLFSEKGMDKARLARFMLLGEENIQKVNAIVHPAVARDFVQSGEQWMECAILFESGFDRFVDRIVCVCAPEEVRIARVMARDAISREKAIEWMQKQWPQEAVVEKSHYLIINDGLLPIDRQLDQILNDLQISHE